MITRGGPGGRHYQNGDPKNPQFVESLHRGKSTSCPSRAMLRHRSRLILGSDLQGDQAQYRTDPCRRHGATPPVTGRVGWSRRHTSGGPCLHAHTLTKIQGDPQTLHRPKKVTLTLLRRVPPRWVRRIRMDGLRMTDCPGPLIS